MAVRDLVFAAGDRVRTWGRYVARPDGEWLDLARIQTPISKPAGWKSARSVRLIWTDAEAVPTDWAANRGPGYLSVVGIWRDESIEVEEQSSEAPAQEPSAARTNPPCPPPPGGWRRDVLPWDPDFGDLRSSEVIVHAVVFRPSADQEVLVIAATDVETATRQLSKYLPDQLCLVPSRFTRAQLDEVRDVLRAKWWEWRLESSGTSSDAHAQPFIRTQLFRVTPELAEWADSLPEGLLHLRPSITPA
ncbi:hypothetical protein [Kribbella sp. NPDC003557]|uniref:hypothetical protein n=1 Tax=Kribbella sp. NPDC003557 TaxID=3154449 RepID=UPI0033AD1790